MVLEDHPQMSAAQVNHPKMGIESRNMMILMVGLWLVYGWFLVGFWVNMIYYDMGIYGM